METKKISLTENVRDNWHSRRTIFSCSTFFTLDDTCVCSISYVCRGRDGEGCGLTARFRIVGTLFDLVSLVTIRYNATRFRFFPRYSLQFRRKPDCYKRYSCLCVDEHFAVLSLHSCNRTPLLLNLRLLKNCDNTSRVLIVVILGIFC